MTSARVPKRGATFVRLKKIVLSAIAGLVVLGLTGCGGARAAASAPSTETRDAATAVASATVGWQTEAQGVGRALEDLEDSIASIPEPKAGQAPDGTFGALILGVDEASRTITVDRCEMLSGSRAEAAAKRARVEGSGNTWVNNRTAEKLVLPVDANAAFVLWYPGESALNVSPPDFAAMSALTFDEFAEVYRTDAAQRDGLATGGAWLTVSDGKVSSLAEPLAP